MIHPLIHKIYHVLNRRRDISAESVYRHNSFAPFVKSGEYRALNLRLFPAVIVQEQDRSIQQIAIFIIKAHGLQRLLLEFLSLIVFCVKSAQRRKLRRIVPDIRDQNVILRVLAFHTHFYDFFICRSVGKAISSHENGRNVFVFQDDRLDRGFRNPDSDDKALPVLYDISDKGYFHLRPGRQVFIDLIVKIIPLIIRSLPVESN